jgi:hypothetical protein
MLRAVEGREDENQVRTINGRCLGAPDGRRGRADNPVTGGDVLWRERTRPQVDVARSWVGSFFSNKCSLVCVRLFVE